MSKKGLPSLLLPLVLVSFAVLSVEGVADPDPRGFTEDPLDTEEKFREKGKSCSDIASCHESNKN